MPPHVSSTCVHHQEVKIALHSIWYHHTYRCNDTRGCVMHMCSSSGDKIALHNIWYHHTWYHHTYRCNDTRGCVMQFRRPDDEHMCSKYVEAWNNIIISYNNILILYHNLWDHHRMWGPSLTETSLYDA